MVKRYPQAIIDEALRLHFEDGRNYKQIQEILGINVATAKNWIREETIRRLEAGVRTNRTNHVPLAQRNLQSGARRHQPTAHRPVQHPSSYPVAPQPSQATSKPRHSFLDDNQHGRDASRIGQHASTSRTTTAAPASTTPQHSPPARVITGYDISAQSFTPVPPVSTSTPLPLRGVPNAPANQIQVKTEAEALTTPTSERKRQAGNENEPESATKRTRTSQDTHPPLPQQPQVTSTSTPPKPQPTHQPQPQTVPINPRLQNLILPQQAAQARPPPPRILPSNVMAQISSQSLQNGQNFALPSNLTPNGSDSPASMQGSSQAPNVTPQHLGIEALSMTSPRPSSTESAMSCRGKMSDGDKVRDQVHRYIHPFCNDGKSLFEELRWAYYQQNPTKVKKTTIKPEEFNSKWNMGNTRHSLGSFGTLGSPSTSAKNIFGLTSTPTTTSQQPNPSVPSKSEAQGSTIIYNITGPVTINMPASGTPMIQGSTTGLPAIEAAPNADQSTNSRMNKLMALLGSWAEAEYGNKDKNAPNSPKN